MSTSQMFPFFWSWICLVAGILVEVKSRGHGGIKEVVTIVILFALTFAIGIHEEDVSFGLGLIAFFVGMLMVALGDLFGVKLFTKDEKIIS